MYTIIVWWLPRVSHATAMQWRWDGCQKSLVEAGGDVQASVVAR